MHSGGRAASLGNGASSVPGPPILLIPSHPQGQAWVFYPFVTPSVSRPFATIHFRGRADSSSLFILRARPSTNADTIHYRVGALLLLTRCRLRPFSW
jgi:hypothetical protein